MGEFEQGTFSLFLDYSVEYFIFNSIQLEIKQLDLYLIHSPTLNENGGFESIWLEFEQFKQEELNKVRFMTASRWFSFNHCSQSRVDDSHDNRLSRTIKFHAQVSEINENEPKRMHSSKCKTAYTTNPDIIQNARTAVNTTKKCQNQS